MILGKIQIPMAGSTLKNDLVSCWECDELYPVTAYDSHGSNNGSIYSSSVAANQTGKIGRCFGFNSDNFGKITVADNASFDNTGTVTVNAWIKYSGYSTTTLRGIFCYGTYTPLLKIGVKGNSTFYIEIEGATSNGVYFGDAGDSTLIANTWYMMTVCIVKSTYAVTVYVYIDNSLYYSDYWSASGSWNLSPTTAVYLGSAGSPSTSGWRGYLDQTAFWKRELTSTERGMLYNSGNGLAYASW